LRPDLGASEVLTRELDMPSHFAKISAVFAVFLALGLTGCAPGAIDDASETASSERGLSGVSGNNWMSALDDQLMLSQLTIPGTHDAMAQYEPVSGTARCQNLGLGDQLRAGVRFIDIRCRHLNDSFVIHHDLVYQHANFDDVIGAVAGFLNDNPSETVIMSVKEEYTASGNTRSFEQTFNAYVAKNPRLWNLASGIGTLGNARGKITLLRRFKGAAQGIDASVWSDNTTFTVGSLRVQDNYKISSTGNKWSQVSSLLDEARNGDQSTLYVDFASGTQSFVGVPNIPSVSGAINPKLSSYFTNVSGRYGIVAMDFVDSGRAAQIYNANSGFLAFRSYNYGDGFITSRSSGEAYRDVNGSDDSAYQLVPGLADPSCVSFRSRRYPDRYLRHANYLLWTDADTGGPFVEDATFCVRPALNGNGSYRSFESFNFPGYYIRHASGRLRIDAYEDSDGFRGDATWQYTPR
jgi:1-phosphatidylinositol phosphodiesterase